MGRPAWRPQVERTRAVLASPPLTNPPLLAPLPFRAPICPLLPRSPLLRCLLSASHLTFYRPSLYPPPVALAPPAHCGRGLPLEQLITLPPCNHLPALPAAGRGGRASRGEELVGRAVASGARALLLPVDAPRRCWLRRALQLCIPQSVSHHISHLLATQRPLLQPLARSVPLDLKLACRPSRSSRLVRTRPHLGKHAVGAAGPCRTCRLLLPIGRPAPS